MHPWLQPVDGGAELGVPLILQLYPIHCVDCPHGSQVPGEGILCVHIARKSGNAEEKKTSNAEHREGRGSQPKSARGQLQGLHLYVNFTLLPGAQRCSLLLEHLGRECMLMRVQPLPGGGRGM